MPPVPLHKLFLSYPESFQFVNSSLVLESEEETFSSHLSEPLLMAEGGSESRTGGGLQAGGVGGGLLPRVWLQLPGLHLWRSDNTAHPPSLLSVPGRVFFSGPFQQNLSKVINTQTLQKR